MQRRVINERAFGKLRPGRRFFSMSLVSALILSAPAYALVVWYFMVAASSHYSHAAATGSDEPLTPEVLHLHLHDHLTQNRRRLVMPDALEDSPLPTYGLMLSNDALDRLERSVPPGDGKAYYVPAHFTRGDEVFAVKVRYRGRKPWHWNHPQKSYKVRMPVGQMFDGRATFNLVNTPEPMPFDENIIFAIAREEGLLTPDYYPFRLFLNNAYWGVYFFETQPDEGLLRRSHRMPGSIFSGNGAPTNPATGVSDLWNATKHWQKVSAIENEQLDDFSELQALLDVVRSPSDLEFAQFAARHLDLEKFALFDALDVIFGVNEHDFGNNHKLYFDPYRGRYEPIAWDFRGGTHESELNRTENPLLLRLKQLPEYVTIRNRTVRRLLDGSCSIEAMRERVSELLDLLRADQIRDPYWDAYELLPSMGAYYRQLPRPMTLERQSFAVSTRLGLHEERERFLREVLGGHDFRAEIFQGQPDSGEWTVDLVVNGAAGVRLREVAVESFKRCSNAGRWQLFADTNLSGALEYGADKLLASADDGDSTTAFDLSLFPGVELIARKAHENRGNVKTVPVARRYRLFLDTEGCRPTGLKFQGTNMVTARPVTLEPTVVSTLPTQPSCTLEFKPRPGDASPHPWCLQTPEPQTIRLGPGTVQFPISRVFERHESVEIAPGTTLRLGRDASLIFLGRVMAEGRRNAPIRVVPADGYWGGIVLQGPGTAGSRLSHVVAEHGTRPRWGIVHYPGMVNIHDTDSVEVAHSKFGHNKKSDDVLHVAYVRDLVIRGTTVEHAKADAIDLELSSDVVLSSLTIVDAGDDGIDVMTSDVKLDGSRLVGFVGNAVSVGERADVTVENTLAAHGGRGILVKNSSTVSLSGVLVYRTNVGLRLEPVSQWYPGKSHVRGETLHAVQCKTDVEADGRKLKRLGRIETRVAAGELEALRRQLALSSWSELETAVSELEGSAQ